MVTAEVRRLGDRLKLINMVAMGLHGDSCRMPVGVHFEPGGAVRFQYDGPPLENVPAKDRSGAQREEIS